MNVTDQTINVLKNFAAINPNLVFKPGNVVKTISEAKNILAQVKITEDIPQEFGIYDLNEFLNVIGMFDEPVLLFDESGKKAKIADAKAKQSVNYFFSDQSILTYPQKDVTMPNANVKFTLSAEQMAQLKRAASTLGVSDVVISNESGKTTIKVTDTADATSNSYELELSDVTVTGGTFTVVFNIGNFKFVAGEYDVEISDKLISHFTNKTLPVEYWVALEKSSKFAN